MLDPVIPIQNRGIDTPVSLFGLKPCAVSCGIPYCEANPLLAGSVEWNPEDLRSESCCIGQIDDLPVNLRSVAPNCEGGTDEVAGRSL
jgi:hypothetical protein